uniref:GIY-YIG domain-containing protein n=1 Tax=viral metagenome TaxID=1070528 RepID=A0A6C0DZT0_9ZZZZ
MITDTDKNTQLSINSNHSFKLIYIYQITCNDSKITDNYIGKTDCFKSRENSHYNASKDSDLKVYKIIRENGGWNNWRMKILNHYYCKDEYDMRQIEQKYIDFYKPTMNSTNACSKPFKNEELNRQIESELKNYSDKILGCFLYDFLLDDFLDYNVIFTCEYCNAVLKTQNSLIKHQKTNKKCTTTRENKNIFIETEKYVCEFCDKEFTTKQSKDSHLKNTNCKVIYDNNEKIKNKDDEIKVIYDKFNEKIKNKDDEINKYRNQIKILQAQLKETEIKYLKSELKSMKDIVIKIVSEPKTINNN